MSRASPTGHYAHFLAVCIEKSKMGIRVQGGYRVKTEFTPPNFPNGAIPGGWGIFENQDGVDDTGRG